MPSSTPDPSSDLRPALANARRALAILEEQAAAFGSLHIPAYLQIELEDQRKKVSELEEQLMNTSPSPAATLAPTLATPALPSLSPRGGGAAAHKSPRPGWFSSGQPARISTLEKLAALAAIAALFVALGAWLWPNLGRLISPTETPPIEIEYTGRVVDGITLESIPNAEISLEFQGVPPVVYTDSAGVFRFKIGAPGKKIDGRIRVEAGGYAIYERLITLEADNPVIEDIRLSPTAQP